MAYRKFRRKRRRTRKKKGMLDMTLKNKNRLTGAIVVAVVLAMFPSIFVKYQNYIPTMEK
jgi:hypothetical protein